MIFAALLSFAAALPAPPQASAGGAASSSSPSNQVGANQGGASRGTASRTAVARQAALRNQLASGQGTQSATLGGNFTVGPAGPAVSVQPTAAPGVFQLFLDDPGTGWQESMLVGIPAQKESLAPPLLVMFHGADVSEFDCYVNTSLFQDALNRGWYVVAPLGAHQVNFGIPYSQVNIEYALEVFGALVPYDPNRVYGIGFSMGGGTMMSYAARHLDPSRPRFAAVVNHTGGVSVANTYWNLSDTFILDHVLTFGGSPIAFPFLYSQASTVDIDFTTSVVDAQTDQGRNLAHIPVLNSAAQNDPLSYLINQNQVLQSWLSAIPGMETYLLLSNHNFHAWSTIDEPTALNYLISKTLVVPKEGEHRILADREAMWHHFYVYQDAPGAFTPFRWVLNSSVNSLIIDETANLSRMVVNSQSLGLNTAVNADIQLGTADGTAEVTTITGYALLPQQVLRNGIPTNDWSWDPVSKSVTLNESNAAGHPTWRIRP